MFVPNLKLHATNLSNPACCVPFAAGIICFSISPITNNIYLLLGLESEQKVWCDFGGRLNDGESVEGAASREFCEESLCVIDMNTHVSSFEDYVISIKQMIRIENYYMRIEILQSTSDGIDHTHVYFLKQIPWQPKCKESFLNLRTQILNKQFLNHPSIDSNQEIDVHWLEKSKIKWWSMDRLKDVIKNTGKYKQHRFKKSFLPALNVVLKILTV